MIDGTDLGMTEIALASGFGSVRSFNAAFQQVYRRPPTAIRRRTAG
jgi:AraC family transcriptional regulator of adaptative response / DNA-3-methyladenine glycosylase II